MGAFETFVNSNLGIRKPLISDVGHPSGSANAAGVVGSHYLDSSSNSLYEKTGENNATDWIKIRNLGQSVEQSEAVFSDSLNIPVGINSTGILYQDLSPSFNFSPSPVVNVTMGFEGFSEYFYAYSLHNVSSTGFYVSFSDEIQEIGNNLNINIS